MAAKTVNVSALFSDLARFGQNGEWQRAFKTTNKILQLVPDDAKTLHCKVVCMVQLSQFQEALNVINKNSKITNDLAFEKAYCLYRLNKTEEALTAINTVNNPSHKIKELKAQVLYRLERYEECYNVYRDLIKNSQDDYEDERETNLAAVIANLHACKNKLAKEVTKTREDTYELTYNSGCALVAGENYVEAEQKLLKAEDLCKKTLEEDDVADDEIESEVGIIRVQLGYVLQMMGKKEKAIQLYSQVLKQKPSDPGLCAVASNNVVSINKDQNVFDSKKKMKVATAAGLEHKLTSQQQLVIALNQCLLFMYTNQVEHCKELLKNLKLQFTHNSDVVLVEAALYCHERNVNRAIDTLKHFAEENSENSLNISFTLVQLLLTQGRVSQACSVLKSLGDVSFKPGVVSALVTLYQSIEDKASAAQTLEDAVDWYKKHQPKSQELVLLWREAANFHLNNGDAHAAARSLEELRKIYPKDMKTLAQLITAYSKFDNKKALLASKDLPPVAEVSKSIDVDVLESTAWAMGVKYFKKAAKTEPSPGTGKSVISTAGTDELIKKRNRKKKKGKLPKNYDPTVDPDPERWLPRRERSTYKKRKDRRGGGVGGIGKGTQGATAGSAEMEVASKPSVNAASSPRPNAATVTPTPVSQGPRQQRPQPAQKKKKKKGGRW